MKASIGLRRPRVRGVKGSELRLPSFEAAAKADPLDRHTLEAMASGVTMRRYGRCRVTVRPAGAPALSRGRPRSPEVHRRRHSKETA
jgi:hypothetical protein